MLDRDGRLYAFYDLHAHVKFNSSFIFGNEYDDLDKNLEIRLLPKIISLLCPIVKY